MGQLNQGRKAGWKRGVQCTRTLAYKIPGYAFKRHTVDTKIEIYYNSREV